MLAATDEDGTYLEEKPDEEKPAPTAGNEEESNQEAGLEQEQEQEPDPQAERIAQLEAQAAEERDDRRCLRGYDRAGEDASSLLADRGDRACLMDVECHILGGPLHESRSRLL